MKPKPLTPGTQNDAIHRHLARGRTLTPMTALRLFRCWRLSGRIYELRRRGYRIKRRMVDLPNGKTVASYFLPKRAHR